MTVNTNKKQVFPEEESKYELELTCVMGILVENNCGSGAKKKAQISQ
jgi:hypothetical protein